MKDSIARSRTVLVATLTLSLLLSSSTLEAHGGGGGHEEPRPSSHGPEPEDDGLTGRSDMFGAHNNEQPEQVDILIQQASAEVEAARGRQALSEDVADLEQKLTRLKIRRSIADKRRKRDSAKKSGLVDKAMALDLEIHALKQKIKSASVKKAPAEHAH